MGSATESLSRTRSRPLFLFFRVGESPLKTKKGTGYAEGEMGEAEIHRTAAMRCNEASAEMEGRSPGQVRRCALGPRSRVQVLTSDFILDLRVLGCAQVRENFAELELDCLVFRGLLCSITAAWSDDDCTVLVLHQKKCFRVKGSQADSCCFFLRSLSSCSQTATFRGTIRMRSQTVKQIVKCSRRGWGG